MSQRIVKVLSFRDEARKKLFEGVTILADAVTTTLGPKGRNVAIQRQWGLPIVVHDGVTVAREVDDTDPLVAMGINLVREAANKTNEETGDGTTTATLLAYELVKGGMKLIDEGLNPMVLRRQIYDILPGILAELKKLSVEAKSKEQIARVAYISAADETIGKLVGEAIDHVGEDGLVTVEEGSGLITEVDYTEGMEFKRGWLSPYFITNEQRMEAVIVKPIIAIVNRKLSLVREIVPMLEAMSRVSKDIVVIAQSVSGDALATMAANKMKGNINAVAVEAPGTATKVETLEDLALVTGATLLSDEKPVDINNAASWVGRAEKVIVSRDTTVIIGGGGDKKAVKARIEALRKLKDEETNRFEKEKLEERLAKMSTGVGVIKVGAKTEIDMREKVERVKDAVGAARAAKDEGIVAGGGTAFLRLREVVTGETEGARLLKQVLEAPARKLMINSGETADVINTRVKEILTDLHKNWGYEVETGQMKDLVTAGIIDPAKVIRLSLENAIGVATSILTTDCVISFKLEGEDK